MTREEKTAAAREALRARKHKPATCLMLVQGSRIITIDMTGLPGGAQWAAFDVQHEAAVHAWLCGAGARPEALASGSAKSELEALELARG